MTVTDTQSQLLEHLGWYWQMEAESATVPAPQELGSCIIPSGGEAAQQRLLGSEGSPGLHMQNRGGGGLHLLRSVSQVVYLGLSAIEEGSPQTQTGACGSGRYRGRGVLRENGLAALGSPVKAESDVRAPFLLQGPQDPAMTRSLPSGMF